MILLPAAALAGWTRKQLEMVLLHELPTCGATTTW